MKSSSGQLVTHRCSFSLSPRCSFSSSSSHSLAHSKSPLFPIACPRGASGCLYSEMHSIHFQSPGFSSGAVLILSEAVSTTSLTPCIALCLSSSHSSSFEREQNNALYKCLETSCRITKTPGSMTFIICMEI